MSSLIVDSLPNQDPQLCKAWVNFNGTGTVAIRTSYNVDSITDNGTGDFSINFTNSVEDGDYSWFATAYEETGLTSYGVKSDSSTSASALNLIMRTVGASSAVDIPYMTAVVFR